MDISFLKGTNICYTGNYIQKWLLQKKLEGVLATPIPSRKVIITEKCKAVLMNIMHEAVPFKGLQQW